MRNVANRTSPRKRIVPVGQKTVRIVDTSKVTRVSAREVAHRLGARVVGKAPK